MRERGKDRTSANAPEAESLSAEFWKSARVVMPNGKTPFTCVSTATWSSGSRRVAKDT